MTRRDFDRINDNSKPSMYTIINALVALSPSLFNAKLFLRPELHRQRRRSRFQCAPHDLPRPNRDIEQYVYPIRRYSASFTILAPAFPGDDIPIQGSSS
jgi:hypothetical protein